VTQAANPALPSPVDQGAPPSPPNPAAGSANLSSLPPLDQLLAPIALYPDPLIALILPSATVPSEIDAAAQFLNGQGDPSQIPVQPWSDSVKGLAHYPQVVAWMDQNMPWTQQLGGAFASEPAAVMNAIQELRARAQAAGALQSGPQAQVVMDNGAIEIEPAQPDVIYVPGYDPNLVYFGAPGGTYPGSYFYWGEPYPMGSWLAYDFDWRGRGLWRGDWYDYRREHGGWGRPVAFASVRFSNSPGPQRWGAPASPPHWSGAAARDFARPAPAPFRDSRVEGGSWAPGRERPYAGPRAPQPGREMPRGNDRERR
jgi:hypothetical protein